MTSTSVEGQQVHVILLYYGLGLYYGLNFHKYHYKENIYH
jgi:hypothetical protein